MMGHLIFLGDFPLSGSGQGLDHQYPPVPFLRRFLPRLRLCPWALLGSELSDDPQTAGLPLVCHVLRGCEVGSMLMRQR